ncbi:NUDIX hydrolase [Spirulina sp. CS-785/01]|uniref:NUDIX hydrolase n=1 Tax=Spirulina sp. CS-785/01 TaxID=3021716 RepID=UPI00232E98C9|nr:NUDIX hydrolase [Spirulina sp. CS-785/01]MDB9315551.1 NUDIX hydrolase [Spirulina sp. CS-785/01]
MTTPWKTLSRFVNIQSPWLTVIGEHLQDDQGKPLDYWRVEKDDSVIVLPLHNQQLLLPQPMYRPGVQSITLDFPGGRRPASASPEEAAYGILNRELGILPPQIATLTPLNAQGWEINSSFSNQRLYGFVATLHPQTVLDTEKLGETYPHTSDGIDTLLSRLTCLQCRMVLLEWLRQG